MSAATEHGRKPTKRLKQHDHGHQRNCHVVTLSQQTAQAMADSFFKFVVQEHLQQHLSRMSAGQILVLCIFHSRLSWLKGKPLQLHTEAIIHSSFISECTFTSTRCTTNTALCYRACTTRDAATMQLLPVWQGIHRLTSTVEALRARTPQLGRGSEAHTLGS